MCPITYRFTTVVTNILILIPCNIIYKFIFYLLRHTQIKFIFGYVSAFFSFHSNVIHIEDITTLKTFNIIKRKHDKIEV